MTNVDEQFIKDLEQCLKAADQLSELDTEEARLFVSEQLQDLQKFLQKKQKDAEARIEEEIKKEENEIDKLKDRIDRTKDSDGANESDIAYTELGLLWTILKDEFWQLAFNAFISETKDSVKVILETLIAILKTSFSYCNNRATKNRIDLKFQAYYPGENAEQNRNLKLPKEIDPNLEGICKTCQKKSTPFCITSIQQAVISDVQTDRSVAKHFKYTSKMLKDAIQKYLEKCVEFCWIACFEEPEIRLITTPHKECKNISHEFIGLDRATYKARQGAAYVEWPAVVQGDKILMPWQLYPANQPRPDAKDIRGDQSQDYRVTRVESKDGTLIKETEEDKLTQKKHQTPSETNEAGTDQNISRTQDKTINANESDSSKIRETMKQEKPDQKKGYKQVKHEKDKIGLNF